MAVELLLLDFSGPDGREPGTIIDIRECPDGGSVKWGRAECPPHFKILHIDGVTKNDLDPSMLEFGGHRSRIKIDEDRMDAKDKADLRAGKKAKIAKGKLVAASVDRGDEWQPKPAIAEEVGEGVIKG
jgi:hypothetical protein